MMQKQAKFNIGDLVLHKRMRYRAIVVDADALFQASGYNAQAIEYPFAIRNPWYRLLVDGSSQVTYVEENMLIPDPSQQPIHNPNLTQYLREHDGGYLSSSPRH
jgi:heat shock protein HspQ